VTRVEVQKIDPPADITEAMSRQMKAERDKRAAILDFEGVKQSQILQAEGVRQSEILRAEGDAQAKVLRATADAKAIELSPWRPSSSSRIGPRSARSWTCSAKCSPSRASSSSRRDRIGPRASSPVRPDRR